MSGGGLYQQLQWGRGLRGLYVQVLATGETGVQGPLIGYTNNLSPAVGEIPLLHIYMYIFTFTSRNSS